MRQLMRRIPHPVVVITAASPGLAPTTTSLESTFRGMTVSSFNTVTLSPTPLVSFNVRVPSATHAALASSRGFLVHLLSASRAGARIADAFTRGNTADGRAFRYLVTGEGSEDDVQVLVGRGTQEAPLIAGTGVMQVLRCNLVEGKEIEVGDHRILVAEVVGIVPVPGVKRKGEGESDTMGLIYGEGRYRNNGESLTLRTEGEGWEENSGPVRPTQGLNVRRGDEHLAPEP